MRKDDPFEPSLGRMRAARRTARPYLQLVIAAASRARPRAGRGSKFAGNRIGRGCGVARVLAARGERAAWLQRRVIIKTRIVSLSGKGLTGVQAHLRYIEREGVGRDGHQGLLYGPESDRVEAEAFRGRCSGDPHQFRFIISPEDGQRYEDLQLLTRRLMARLEADLGTGLDWVAVDHFNTAHPHTHVVLRGVDDRGRALLIAREYLTLAMRERAAELLELDLGPKRQIEQEVGRATGLEQALRIGRGRGPTQDKMDAAPRFEATDERRVVGCLVAQRMSADRLLLAIEGVDGRRHEVHVDQKSAAGGAPLGAILSIERGTEQARLDREVARIAAAHDGRYSVDVHLRHDPTATQRRAEEHVRRLEALQHGGACVARQPDGSWQIGNDHVAMARAHDGERLGGALASVRVLSRLPLEQLVSVDALTWLDRELTAGEPETLAKTGFGSAVREALRLRRRWLIGQQLGRLSGNRFLVSPDLHERLRDRELARAGTRLANELGRHYSQSRAGESVAGTFSRALDLTSGRFALIERSRDFTLLPWRSELEGRTGQRVLAHIRSGGVIWTFGRERSGPSIT